MFLFNFYLYRKINSGEISGLPNDYAFVEKITGSGILLITLEHIKNTLNDSIDVKKIELLNNVTSDSMVNNIFFKKTPKGREIYQLLENIKNDFEKATKIKIEISRFKITNRNRYFIAFVTTDMNEDIVDHNDVIFNSYFNSQFRNEEWSTYGINAFTKIG